MTLEIAHLISPYTDIELACLAVSYGVLGGVLIFRVGSYVVWRLSERSVAQ